MVLQNITILLKKSTSTREDKHETFNRGGIIFTKMVTYSVLWST